MYVVRSSYAPLGCYAQINRRGETVAEKLNIGTLVVMTAYAKTFKTGSRGFHGKLVDPATGKTYQVQAVEIGSKK